MAHPKALLFDVFGTVVDWRSTVAREIEAVAQARGHTVDGHAFALALRGRYIPSMDRIQKGEREFVLLDVLHRENLVETLAEFDMKGLSASEIDDLNHVWHRLDAWGDSAGGLNRLKSRHILATCSNGNIALMVNMARRAALNWDVILGAEVTGAYKPDRQCYVGSAAALGLEPQECCMVAAHNADLAAARSFGLMTAYIERPCEYLPAPGKPRPAADQWDWCASSLLDLADQMGC